MQILMQRHLKQNTEAPKTAANLVKTNGNTSSKLGFNMAWLRMAGAHLRARAVPCPLTDRVQEQE